MRITALEESAQQRDRDIADFQTKFRRLDADVGGLGSEVSEMRSGLAAEVAHLQTEVSALKAEVAAAVQPLLSSTIISDFPEIFAEFRGKQFKLLWCGSRDGFGLAEFHSRCDGHPNTITVILDIEGNIFGGFTPLKWDSSGGSKADESLKSFLFTLKNWRNVAARRFPLKTEEKHRAIYCASDRSLHFNDMAIKDNCNENTDSYAS
jgi:hypothetical protein